MRGFNRLLPFTGQHLSTYYWDRDLWMQAWEWQLNSKLYPYKPPFEIKTHFEEIPGPYLHYQLESNGAYAGGEYL